MATALLNPYHHNSTAAGAHCFCWDKSHYKEIKIGGEKKKSRNLTGCFYNFFLSAALLSNPGMVQELQLGSGTHTNTLKNISEKTEACNSLSWRHKTELGQKIG